MTLGSFEEVMMNRLNKKKTKLAAEMSKFSSINFLTKESKVKLSYFCKNKVFSKGQTAYLEGQSSDMIYMVKR